MTDAQPGDSHRPPQAQALPSRRRRRELEQAVAETTDGEAARQTSQLARISDEPALTTVDTESHEPATLTSEVDELTVPERPGRVNGTVSVGSPETGSTGAGASGVGVPVPGESQATGAQTEGPAAEVDAGADPSDEAPRRRSGRNMPVAIGVGIALLAAVVVSVVFVKEVFVGLAIIAVCLALWELTAALRHKDIHIPIVPVLVGAVGMMLSAYIGGSEALLTAFALTAGCVFVWRLLDGTGMPAVRDVAAGIFATAYIPLLAGFAMLMLAEPDGAKRLLFFIALPVASDTAGLAAGVLFGRHPLAPSVSPKKTWEGLAGSLVLACAAGAGLAGWLFDGAYLAGAALGLLAVAASTFGDLAESMLKRDLSLKDMGSLLPGHGGLLDRLDSVLFAAPVIYTAMLIILP